MSVGLDNVTFSYGNTPVLENVTWRLPEQGVVCLWGPSGCGKTTLLRLLAGLEKPDRGELLGAPKVAMVFQEDRLLPWLTAAQNVTVIGVNEDMARDQLRSVGLTEGEITALPGHLSGGQQRRVALARALAADSDCLLMDEPFNGLDENTWQNVVPLISAYAQHRPVVLVTHVREQAEALGATVIPLKAMPVYSELKAENL